MSPSVFRVVPMMLVAATCAVAWLALSPATAQRVDTTPSRQTLDNAAADNCENISSVVQRCADKPDVSAPKGKDDTLDKSRAQTKAGFDRVDKRASDRALAGAPPTANTPVGDAQQLGGVTVTGKGGDDPPQPEAVIQKALAPPERSANGTVSKYAPNGTRYDCIEKCVGPACCVEIRALPNPAREVNSLNGH